MLACVCILLPVIHSYPQRANKFLVAGELGSDNRKNMPVILLHDGKHEQSFLLQSCTKLEERGLLILQRHRETATLAQSNTAERRTATADS